MPSRVLNGIAASDGVAIAESYRLVDPDLSFDKVKISDVNAQATRLSAALVASKRELAQIKEHAIQTMGEDEAAVFDAHLAILSDPEMIRQIVKQIRDQRVSAEEALTVVTDSYVKLFENMQDNPYMRERSGDIRDVTKRVLAHLLGVELPNPALIDHEVIVVAHDLTPSDTAQLDRRFVKGFITDIGGRTSHSAIMSRTLEIPAVVGTKEATSLIEDGQPLILDGIHGQAILQPTSTERQEYHDMAIDYQTQRIEWQKLQDKPSVTKDGVHHVLAANIGTPEDLTAVKTNGAEGVGLFRSEFLYMNANNWPTEDDQFEAYRTVVQGMAGKPVVVRTMDIGGDKGLPYLDMPKEMNPFMGYRAIRISLSKTAIFRTQLRALLRASAYGDLGIMFPMIATLDEFHSAKRITKEEHQKLLDDDVPVGDPQLGIMVEVPAAAILADQFAKEVDFMSIGTNDLIGYSMAADRTNERVSYLYQPYNPAILRLIKHVIDACHQEGKIAAMCGEMAGDQLAVPILVGMGLDEFSMSATSILKTRALFRRLDSAKMAVLADKAIHAGTNEEVIKLVDEFVF
ncbi:phosphoenolpyruvate--protein phosphotransferase [Secundilactobacillus paracollinoides]|uniref:phosphoenolpyruvate--protein phosphotransferase n=1 Tax=Secundilactobacillus paracollinoides TaxID=240427 RepID=UPI00081A9EC8|nr:phosphoenolpyruvate--protein phosphotransferase [Secundilactobacillus paracollinoides]ANZ63997.1 phosphoenolpyruvate--protein phosphotransferase [Secundilactobacillus paracollinoides]